MVTYVRFIEELCGGIVLVLGKEDPTKLNQAQNDNARYNNKVRCNKAKSRNAPILDSQILAPIY
jgi:hypothetical protein